MRKSFPTVQVLLIAMMAVSAAPAQTAYVVITPHVATMTVGDSRPFRLVNQDGQKQSDVSWSVSDPKALELSSDDDMTVEAKEPGEFHLSARGSWGNDEITITVVEGAMKTGTILWSDPPASGCKAGKMTQAVPSATGPDLYSEEDCPDGHYVTALTANGMQIWRRKIGAVTASTPSATAPIAMAPSGPYAGMMINVHSRSVCDFISLGDSQQTIRTLLQQKKLPFSEANHAWVVEESGSKCTLWFDDKAAVVKKRMTLVSE